MEKEIAKQELTDFIRHAVAKWKGKHATMLVSDFFIQLQPENNTIIFLDEDEEEILSWVIEDWSNTSYEQIPVMAQSELKEALFEVRQEGLFDSLNIVFPFSVSLIDDTKETLSELLLIDEENVILDDHLMKNLDQELNDFLNQLMADV